jgi:hypothetical protein
MVIKTLGKNHEFGEREAPMLVGAKRLPAPVSIHFKLYNIFEIYFSFCKTFSKHFLNFLTFSKLFHFHRQGFIF